MYIELLFGGKDVLIAQLKKMTPVKNRTDPSPSAYMHACTSAELQHTAGAVGRGGHHPVQPERAQAGLCVRAHRRRRDAVLSIASATPRGLGGAQGRGARGRHVVGVMDRTERGTEAAIRQASGVQEKLALGWSVGCAGFARATSRFLKSLRKSRLNFIPAASLYSLFFV